MWWLLRLAAVLSSSVSPSLWQHRSFLLEMGWWAQRDQWYLQEKKQVDASQFFPQSSDWEIKQQIDVRLNGLFTHAKTKQKTTSKVILPIQDLAKIAYSLKWRAHLHCEWWPLWGSYHKEPSHRGQSLWKMRSVQFNATFHIRKPGLILTCYYCFFEGPAL